MAAPSGKDALLTLREYQRLAPWSLRDLATLATSILEVSRVRPISAAARARPNERTIRYYVTRGLVAPPDGKGPAATYTYRHLLHVLAIKLRQMEGANLATIAEELLQTTGDVVERRVAATLGDTVPPPHRLALTPQTAPARGRAGRILSDRAMSEDRHGQDGDGRPTTWRRIAVEPGVELHLADDHLLARLGNSHAGIADAIGHTIARLLGAPDTDTPPQTELDHAPTDRRT